MPFGLEPSDFVKSKSHFHWVEIAWRCICVLTFLSGVVMLVASQRRTVSDRECTAQLSVWCEFANPVINQRTDLRMKEALLICLFETAPMLEAVEYERKDWTSGLSASEFSAPPTPKLEAAWSEISNCMFFWLRVRFIRH